MIVISTSFLAEWVAIINNIVSNFTATDFAGVIMIVICCLFDACQAGHICYAGFEVDGGSAAAC